MNWKAVSRNIGYALLVSALFMLLSILVSVLNGNDSALAALIISFTITFIVGIFPFIFVRKTPAISLKEGYVIITLSWLLSFLFGMLPYALWGGPFTLQNAWFESVSGFTTTGSTILENVEALPKSLLFWRSSTHFIGGLGVVVFLLLIIPDSSPVRLRLTNMELSSLSRSGYSSRANKTVYIFAYVYLALVILSFLCYLLAGMPAFDAVCHAMSVSATGGFSTRNLSIAAFHSPLIEAMTMLFMLLSSLHFGLLYLSVVNRTLKPLNNPVTKFYLASLVCFSLLAGLSVKFSGNASSWSEALWTGAFQTVSTATTTGFAVADNAAWPVPVNVMMMMVAFMCGCAGSTTGGVKADRVLVFMKSVIKQISWHLHPTAVREVKLGTKVLKHSDLYPQLLYLLLFTLIFCISVLLNSFTGMNGHSAFSASLASLSNVGPAIRELGSMGNYSMIPGAAKFICTLDMFLGRVEIYPVLTCFAMIIDKHRK